MLIYHLGYQTKKARINPLGTVWTLPKRRSFCFILPSTYYSIASDLKMLPCQRSLMLVTVKISGSSEMKLKVKPCFVFMFQSICDKNFGLSHSESCQHFDHWIPAEGRAGCSLNSDGGHRVKPLLPIMGLWAYATLGSAGKGGQHE